MNVVCCDKCGRLAGIRVRPPSKLYHGRARFCRALTRSKWGSGGSGASRQSHPAGKEVTTDYTDFTDGIRLPNILPLSVLSVKSVVQMPGIEIGGSHGQSRLVTVINERAHAFLRALSGECWSEEWEKAFAAHSPDNHSSDTSGVPPALPSAAEGAALPRLISKSKNQGGSKWLKVVQVESRWLKAF